MESRWIWQHPEWPRFHWDGAALVGPLGLARRAQGRLQGFRDLLEPGLARDALAAILKAEGVSTSAIEGQHLNPESVAASVARRLGLPPLPGKVPLSLEADGLVSVLMDAVDSAGSPLTTDMLVRWQEALFASGGDGLGRVVVGALRPDEVAVQSGAFGREIVHFQGVPRAALEENLRAFLDWFNAPPEGHGGLVRAALAHLWFVTIHPFEDGNGRLARAITDRAIAQDEGTSSSLLRMSSHILSVKDDYYGALQRAQAAATGLDATEWILWFARQVELACQQSQTVVRHVLAKAKFWARFREVDINQRQRKVLNRLLDAGPSGFEGGLTNRKYVQMTRVAEVTAFRDLDELLKQGCLVKLDRGGRSTAYDLKWDELLN